MFQLLPGEPQRETNYAPNGFVLFQGDVITWDAICWGGGTQQTAVWMYYSIP